MNKLSFLLISLAVLMTMAGTSSAQKVWEYYVPHVVSGPEFYWAHDGDTNLLLIVTEDGTSYEIDQDADGIYENQFSGLPAGTLQSYSRAGHGDPRPPTGTLSIGACVRSDKPLQLLLNFHHNHYGTFDAGFMWTSLMPTDMWGAEFVVPVNSTYLYVFAKSSTQVTITPPGEPPITQMIAARTNIKLSSISSGRKIAADNPVYVLAVNCQPDQNYPWMYNVLPVTQVGTNYYHDATYGEYDVSWPWPTDPKLWITAVDAGTNVYIDENKDGDPEHTYSLGAGGSITYTNPVQGAHIWSTDKIYVVYVENWTKPYGRWGPASQKYGGAATEYIPTSSYGISYAVFDVNPRRELPENNPRIFIVASEDNTQVNVDYNWDGADVSNTLNRGDVWTVVWPEGIGTTAHIWSNKGVQVIYRTDLSHPDHPGVGGAYTAVPLVNEVVPEKVNNLITPIIQNVAWDPITKIFAFDIALTNTAAGSLNPPVTAVITNLFPPPPTITLDNPDGGGNGVGGYWDYHSLLAPDGILSPGETSQAKRWEFYNPDMVGFYFSCDIYAVPSGALPKLAAGGESASFAMTADIAQQWVTIDRGDITKLIVPKEFALEQNYPNPFNPETTIKYQLPRASRVRLTILNLLGQEIRTLVDEEKEAGYHTIVWDGRDNSGKDVASGMYIYRIQAGEFVDIKKMALIR